jgi:hypothetical protein
MNFKAQERSQITDKKSMNIMTASLISSLISRYKMIAYIYYLSNYMLKKY